MYSNFATTTGE